MGVKSFLFSLVALSALGLAGCGGVNIGIPNGDGEVSGNLVDVDGNPVREARITADGETAFSNSSGAYVVQNVREGYWLTKAEVTVDGIQYSGETVAQVFEQERTKNINITLTRKSQQGQIHGVVRDRFGNLVQGAHVYAFKVGTGFTLSSIMDVTNANGEYNIRTLAAGVTYTINASARGYDSDRDTIAVASGEDRLVNFTLSDPSDPLIGAPENLLAVAWTSPATVARNAQQVSALEAIKQRFDPRRAKKTGGNAQHRTTLNGYNVEVDLYWDQPSEIESLLGYGIYRANSSNGVSVPIDFHRDPESTFFADIDDELIELTNYYYEITALNVNYPNTGNSESDFSNRYGVQTLDELHALSPTQGPLTFRWQNGSGATGYYVYLFDEFPALGSVEIWRNATAASGSSVVYNGPALISGRRYYYVVLGLANFDDSRTITEVEEFVAN